MQQSIRVYNTMTRQTERFAPLVTGTMRFYSCGPTVYHYAHLGNLRTYIFNDLLKRIFRAAGYRVEHVMNITDVGHLTSDADSGDDKMEKGAAREGKTVWEVAKFYTDAFNEDLERLNVIAADVICKATDHITEQIAQVQQIMDAGYAYVISDGVYFDTAKLLDYGKLARLKLDDLQAGARVEVAEGKRNTTDFALWKFTRAGEKRQMEWPSPWAEKSYPGWHIECSAMAVKYLGPEFDIHTGGIDHIPVHHTNEIAQAEAAGLPFARYWMHGAFLVEKNNEKMAKSSGEFLTLASLIEKGFDPLAYRYFCLGTHYRKELMFSWDAIKGAQQSLDSLRNKVLHAKEQRISSNIANPALVAKFTDAITDDLNLPKALAVLWDALGDNALTDADKYAFAMHCDAVLGLGLADLGTQTIPAAVTALAQQRESARSSKDWKESDRLRDAIAEHGFIVQDTPQGFVLRKK